MKKLVDSIGKTTTTPVATGGPAAPATKK